MKLKRFVWLLPVLILLSVMPAHAALPEPRILLNGKPMDLPADQRPTIVGGRTLVPMRALFEALGAAISWDQPTQTVTAVKGDTVVKLTVDAPEAKVGDRAVAISPPAQLIGGRTYVPLRAVVDLLGARVGWDGETATIRITDRRPAVGGELTLPSDYDDIYLLDRSPDTSDWAVRALFGDGLVRYSSADMSYEPALAAAMPEVSEDGRTVTFRLRRGITFHDGTEVTASDFIYSFSRSDAHVNPAIGLNVERMSTDGQYTIRIQTKTPHLAGVMRLASLPPLPRHLLAGAKPGTMEDHPFWQAPVGAGPYQFASYENHRLTLERFPEFWEAKINPEIGPWLEKLTFAYNYKNENPERLYLSGKVDAFWGLPGDTLDEVSSQRESAVYTWQRMGYGALSLNVEAWPTNIREVRQALTLALNRQAIVDQYLDGAGVVPGGPYPSYHWAGGFTNSYPYDPQGAIELMEEAGFTRNPAGIFEKDGQEARLLLTVYAGSEVAKTVAEITQKSWNAIGFATDVKVLNYPTMLEEYVYPGKFHAVFLAYNPSPDPAVYYNIWSESAIALDADGINRGANRGRYVNPELESLLVAMKNAPSQDKRTELARRAWAILQEDAPSIWLYSNFYSDLLPKQVQGVVVQAGYGVGRPEYWYIKTE